MGLKEWIVPQDHKFFDLLERISANAIETALALSAMFADFTDLEAKQRHVKDLEHKGDDLVHEMYEALNRSFITPIDHEDFTKMLAGLDDVVDYIDATANLIVLYEIPEPTEGMRSMTALIERQTKELHKAVQGLRHLRHPKEVERACIEVHSLENAADTILNRSISALFRETDPIKILKYKEIYEHLETATDKAEEAAHIIGDIVMKNT